MWKVGIIGAGYWAGQHLTAWANRPDVEVTALCDLDRERLAQRGAEFRIPPQRLFTDPEGMLARADIDIVDIITPPATHLPLVRAAAKSGKHILCIKPFAESLDDAREMVAIVKRHAVRAMVTENWRWLGPIRRVKKILEDDLLGRPYYARYSCLEYATPRMTDDANMSQPFLRRMPRLLFYEMGVHWLDVWRFLFGEPERLYAEMRHVSSRVAGEDLGLISVSHGELAGLLEMSWVSRSSLPEPKGEHERLMIEGETATLIMVAEETTRLVQSNGEAVVVDPNARFDVIESIRRLQAHFLHGIEEKHPFESEFEDNVKTLELVFAAYESAATHRVASFSEGQG